ncbi:aldo/keto reductase [Streptomyces collinus]|uniref:aldo/keto reductase n=1 Tax=Streptomyces collinus TaxID=42684 RepID=UPI00340C79E8
MRYTTFGHRTGPRVSEDALGTANFGTGWGAGAEPDEARRIFDRFAEAGGTFRDSADGYQSGESEELTGKADLRRPRPLRPGHAVGPRRHPTRGHLGALDVHLTGDQYSRLTEVGAVPLGMPHEGIAASLDRLQGGTADRVTAPVVPVA